MVYSNEIETRHAKKKTIDAFRILRVFKQTKAIITARFSYALKNLR